MEKASAPLCLVVTLFAFYFLVPSSAVPLSRVQRLALQEAGAEAGLAEADLAMNESPVEGSTTSKVDLERFIPEEDEATINARMVLETQDYAASGPNNHHKPPGWS